MRTVAAPVAFVLLALAAILSFSFPTGQPAGQITPQPTVSDNDWREIDRLVSEQKFEAAVGKVGEIRTRAQKSGDQDEWTRALIKEVQLRMGLHGYETAVRFLKEQAWPAGELNRAALNLFYARSLVTYYQAYSLGLLPLPVGIRQG